MNGEQKKFLDENGLKILWNQISMHDYPNNAALTSVINAIDANKADKADIPSIDTTLSAAGAAADAKAVGEAIENIELTPGPKGDSGVYVGASAPTNESVNVWINPNGEAADFPTEGGGIKLPELIASGTMEEEGYGFDITKDNDGNPFELVTAILYITNLTPPEGTTSDIGCKIMMYGAGGKISYLRATATQSDKKDRITVVYDATRGMMYAVQDIYATMISSGGTKCLYPVKRVELSGVAAWTLIGAGLTYELWGVRK